MQASAVESAIRWGYGVGAGMVIESLDDREFDQSQVYCHAC